jgi:hypothetical protein
MNESAYASWVKPNHLRAFSDYTYDLPLFARKRNRQIYSSIGRCLEVVIPYCDEIVEIGVGGGRSYSYLDDLSNRVDARRYKYTGYDLSRQCVEFCKRQYGDFFHLSNAVGTQYQKADLVYFFDVMVHSHDPLEFLDAAAVAAKRYLCFQTPTRDLGSTEYDPDKSCRLENGSWIPWIVFNVSELVLEIQKRGFHKILLIKDYKKFAGNAPRFLPKEFFESDVGSARTAVLAIRKEGMNEILEVNKNLANDVTEVLSERAPRMPVLLKLANTGYRKWGMKTKSIPT